MYVVDDGNRKEPRRRGSAMTILLIAACVLTYPYGFAHPDLLDFSGYNFKVLHEWWTPVTAIFVHGSLGHLVGNMFFLLLFGSALESRIGPGRLLLSFLAGGAVSFLLSRFFYPSFEHIVGASGAICTLIGLLMIYSPWRLSFFLLFFPLPLGVAALTYIGLNFLMAYYSAGGAVHGQHIAYEVHIIGFLMGIGFGIFWNPDWKQNLLSSLLSFLGFYLLLFALLFFFVHR